MVRDDLKSLVKFEPAQLRHAVQTCEKEASALEAQRQEVIALAALYRQILRTHGHEETEAPAGGTPPKVPPVVAGSDRRFRGMKLANATVQLLTERGGTLHAQKIIDGLIAGGLRVGGKYPMSTIISAMRRDSRIEKDPTEKNTWRLKV